MARQAGIRLILVLGLLAALTACGAAGAPVFEGGMNLDEFWRR